MRIILLYFVSLVGSLGLCYATGVSGLLFQFLIGYGVMSILLYLFPLNKV